MDNLNSIQNFIDYNFYKAPDNIPNIPLLQFLLSYYNNQFATLQVLPSPSGKNIYRLLIQVENENYDDVYQDFDAIDSLSAEKSFNTKDLAGIVDSVIDLINEMDKKVLSVCEQECKSIVCSHDYERDLISIDVLNNHAGNYIIINSPNSSAKEGVSLTNLCSEKQTLVRSPNSGLLYGLNIITSDNLPILRLEMGYKIVDVKNLISPDVIKKLALELQ